MAFLTLEDFHGTVEVIVFSKTFAAHRDLIHVDSMIMVSGRTSAREDEETKILCNEIIPLDQVRQRFAKNLHLKMQVQTAEDPILKQVNEILQQNPGDSCLYINLNTPEDKQRVIRSKNLKVNPAPNVIIELRSLLGESNVWMDSESD